MPDLPKKKVGLIACSGEELAEGTVTRWAVRKVLEMLRPNDTVTLCLPLFGRLVENGLSPSSIHDRRLLGATSAAPPWLRRNTAPAAALIVVTEIGKERGHGTARPGG